MRTVAVSLLLFAAAVFTLTVGRGGGWGFVNATAEAAMVGAVADWFAVTALFRHPLGLPIPHTAIIPTRKDTLARSLRDFFTENFLTESVVRDRMAAAQVSTRAGRWLSDPAHSSRVVDETAKLFRAGLLRVRDDDVAALMGNELLPRLMDEPLSVVAGQLLQEVVHDGAHRGLVDLALAEGHRWLSAHGDVVVDVVGARAPWWSPQWLDERVAERLHVEAVAWIAEILDDPRHEARRALDELLAQLATDLQNDPGTIERAERLKRRLLSQPQVVTTATALWNALRRALVVTLDDPHSRLRARGVAELTAFAQRLVTDEALRKRTDGYAEDFAVHVVNTYGAELTTVITETIQRWDGEEAARRIELHVGRDLQFIRINGTIVGGLVGLLIHTLTVLR